MFLKTKVKVSSLTNLTDARYFAAWGVDWLGFNLQEGHSDYQDTKTMTEICGWVEGPKALGEFAFEDLEQIKEAIAERKLEAVQISQIQPSELAEHIDVTVFKEWIMDKALTAERLHDQLEDAGAWVDYQVLDFTKGGWTWAELKAQDELLQALKAVCEKHRLWLDLDYKGENMQEILDTLNFEGISIRAGAEEKVGYKSFDDLDEIYDVLLD